MSKEFEEKVLEKLGELDAIKEKVSKIDEIEKKVSNMEEKVSKIDDMQKVLDMHTKELETIEIEICRHNDTFKEIKDEMKEMKHSLTIVEDAVTNKIPALFEIYSLNYGLQKENEKELKVVKKQGFENSVKISNLENITKEHSKQLKKLIS